MNLSSRNAKLLVSIGVPGLAALAVLAANALMLTTYGGATYQRLATLLSVFVAANYFDFGYLGQVRVAAATSRLAPAARRTLVRGLFWSFTRRTLAFEAILGLAAFADGGRHPTALGFAVVAAIAPLVIHVNALRAWLEGADRLASASILRAAFGILVGVSPFVAASTLGDPFRFPWIVAVSALAVAVGFYAVACAGGARDAYADPAGPPVLARAGAIAALETIYVLCGAAFLYGDRYALLALENSARAGTYVFVLEMVSRVSLLYVPVVMLAFPRLVALAESEPAAAAALARRVDRRVLAVVGAALGMGLAVAGALALAGVLPGKVDWRFAWTLAVPLSAAYVFNASSYLHQRLTVVAHDRPAQILGGYLVVLAATVAAFVGLYLAFGVPGAAAAFLLRTVLENVFLRRAVRPLARGGAQPQDGRPA